MVNSPAKILFRQLLVSLTVVVWLSVNANAQGVCEFDNDGVSDIVSVTITDSGTAFSVLYSSSDLSADLGTVAKGDGAPIVSNFLADLTPQVGVLSADYETGLIDWAIVDSSNQARSAQFGNGGDTVVVGADINGDGATDAISVGVQNFRLVWQIDTALFGGDSSTQRTIRWGSKSEQPFFLNLEGNRDVLAVLRRFSGRFVVRTYDLEDGTTARFEGTGTFGSTRPKPRPHPVRQEDGTDHLMVSEVVGDSTDLIFFNPISGSTTTKTIAAVGTVLIGDYTADPGEEIAVQSTTGLIIYNPSTTTLTEKSLPTATLVDGLEFSRVIGPTPTPTPSYPVAPPGLDAVCAQRSAIMPGELLIKAEISAHINNPNDPRTSGYTLVCAKQCPKNQNKADFFYADGSYAGSVGYYGRFSGNGKPRLYGAAGDAPQHFVSIIAPAAKLIGNGKLYMQMSKATTGAETVCKEFNPKGRNGGL